MIVKVVELDKSVKSSFRRLTEYISKEQENSHLNIRNIGSWIEPDNCNYYDEDDLDLFIEDVEAIQSMSKAKSDKTYHLVVSFGVGERPDINILKKISNELVESIGYDKHQRLTVIHDDTDNLHIHIAINKINPEKYTIHEPYYPYKTLSKKANELEKKYNLAATHSDKNKNNIYSVANDIDTKPTQISFKTYVYNVELSDCKSWQDFHKRLNENGIKYEKYGSGAVFRDITNEKINIKSSAVDRSYSLKSLEKKFGMFEPQEDFNFKDIKQSYERYENVALKELYDTINQTRKIKSKQEKQVVCNRYKEEVLPADDMIDNLSRVVGRSDLDKTLIKLNKKIQKQAKEQKLKEEKKKEIRRINDKYKYYTYDAWLQKQALTNDAAGNVLNKLKENRINYIKGDFKDLKKDAVKITRNGTYILSNKLKTTNTNIFITPRYNNIIKAIDTLKKNSVIPDTLNGTDDFKAKVIDIIASNNLDITFKDEEINQKILAAKILKQDNLNIYIKHRNYNIPIFSKFDGKEEKYIYKGYFKHNDKFFIKFKSLKNNTFYIKEPVKDDFKLLKEYKKNDIITINTQIKDSYEVECYVNEKDKTRISFKELANLDNSYKRISTKKYNGQKLYLYKKDNDNNIYVSNMYHVKIKEQENKEINEKNNNLER